MKIWGILGYEDNKFWGKELPQDIKAYNKICIVIITS